MTQTVPQRAAFIQWAGRYFAASCRARESTVEGEIREGELSLAQDLSEDKTLIRTGQSHVYDDTHAVSCCIVIVTCLSIDIV